MSSSTTQQASRPVAPVVAVQTLAQRFLRSLNSLGVVVADSTQAARNN
jgi:hypothetical protein